jgi:hypothetical protein
MNTKDPVRTTDQQRLLTLIVPLDLAGQPVYGTGYFATVDENLQLRLRGHYVILTAIPIIIA